MRSSQVLFALLLASVVAEHPLRDNSKAEIDRGYKEDEEKLITALKGADGSVLVIPLRNLTGLKQAGRRDQDVIAAFGYSQAVTKQHKYSVKFWKHKMDETIEPYVSDPQRYKGLIIDFFPRPPDPTGIDSQEYKDAERKINDMVKNGLDEINQIYKEHLERTKAKKVENATASSWARFQLDRFLEQAEEWIKNGAQFAKREAAEGKAESAVKNVKENVEERKTEFKKQAYGVTKDYQDTVKY